MTALNVASITQAVETLLLNDQDFEQYTISRGEPVNRDPSNCPWVGIYRREHKYDPRTLGKGQGHRQFAGELVLIVQETSLDSGGDCEDLLDAAVRDVMDAILADPQLRATVDMVNSATVSYSYDSLAEDEDEHNHYFQTAYIQMTLEASTS